MILYEGKVVDSLAIKGDGTTLPAALGRYGESLVGALLPALGEATLRGLVFGGCTATSGVAPGTTIGTTAPFTLANPAGSGKVLLPIRATCGYVSGTLGTGTTYYCANTNPAAAAVAGTSIPVIRTRLGVAGAAQGNVGLAFTTSTIVSPTIVRPCISLTPVLATSVVSPYLLLDDYIYGEFAIDPGCSLSFESVAAAGTSPLVIFGMTWMELPV